VCYSRLRKAYCFCESTENKGSQRGKLLLAGNSVSDLGTAVGRVRLSISTLFRLLTLDLDFLACAWVATVAFRRLKVKVI